MKKYLFLLLLTGFFSCSEKQKKSKLVVTAEVKNAAAQKVYLEELYFTQKPPLIVDTAEVNNGKFVLETVAPDEGLYRIRLESGKQFFFINDNDEVKIAGDAKDSTMSGDKISGYANELLYSFINWMNTASKEISALNTEWQQRNLITPNDSTSRALQQQIIAKANNNIQYLQKFVDTVSDPVVAMFALGYLDNSDNTRTMETVASLKKRFPAHKALAELEQQINTAAAMPPASIKKPAVGELAPDISMNDPNGTPISLSSLRGKYVLVDFWASWCGPCRQENPNVVNAFNKFKGKNFTILGVSLDKEKSAWLEAIKEDGLAWQHISDLKFWESGAVKIYGIESIPYNVLVDPDGKIIATDLRGEMLETTLEEKIK